MSLIIYSKLKIDLWLNPLELQIIQQQHVQQVNFAISLKRPLIIRLFV